MRKILPAEVPTRYECATTTDTATVEQVGERVGALYRDHADAVFRFAVHLTGHREDAEDAVQFAFLAVHRTLLRGDHVANPRAWIFQAVKHRVFNVRRNRHDTPASDTLDRVPSRPDDGSDAVREIDRVRSMLWALPESQHQVFVLRHWSGLTYGEIAEVVGTTPTAVESLLHRARSAIVADRDVETACQGVRNELSRSRPLSEPDLAHVRRCRGCRTAQTRLAQAVGIAAMLELSPALHVGQALAATLPGFQTTAAIGGVGDGASVAASSAVPSAAPAAGAGAGTASTSVATGAGVVAKAALVAKVALTALAVAGSVAVAHADGRAILGAAAAQLHRVESHLGEGGAHPSAHPHGRASAQGHGQPPGSAATGHGQAFARTRGHGRTGHASNAGGVASAGGHGRSTSHPAPNGGAASSSHTGARSGAPAGSAGTPAGKAQGSHPSPPAPPASGHAQPSGGSSHPHP